jgi:hypothetical protein
MAPWRTTLSQRRTPLIFSGLALLAQLLATFPCLGFNGVTLLPLTAVGIGVATLVPRRLETSDQFLRILGSVIVLACAPPVMLGCAFGGG